MTSSTRSNVGRGLRTLALLIVCSAGAACSSGDEGGSSSGSHWLACTDHDDCAEHGMDARCGNQGYCIDDAGERIEAPLASGGSGTSSSPSGAGSSGASGSGSGGSTGTSGSSSAGSTGTSGSGSAGGSASDGGSAGGNVADGGSASSAPLTCDGAVLGGVCTYRGDAPQPECCDGDIHLRCVPVGCSSAQPGVCQGMYVGLRLSAACGATPVNPAECPGSQPSTPDACEAPGTACGYADGCCACGVYGSCGPDPVWGCAPKNPGCPDAPSLNAACSSEGLTCFSCEGAIQSFTCEAGAWTYGSSTFGCR
jgi:hypothetical protein